MDLSDIDLLIWDVDGVLINVRGSYRRSIVDSVQFYLSEFTGMNLRKKLISVEDTQRFKLIGGFNDDWKLTYAFVLCFLAKISSELPAEVPAFTGRRSSADKKIGGLKKLGQAVKEAGVDMRLDLAYLASEIRRRGEGLEAAEKALDDIFGSIEIAKRFWHTDLIKDVFQEIYLGEELYEGKYGKKPVFVRNGPGLIRNEKPIVRIRSLKALGERFDMGVASGRERFEIDFSLGDFGFDRFIPPGFIVSSEDVKKGKPDPESLLECRRRILLGGGLGGGVKAAYVGDSIDDVKAAKRAGFLSVGCLSACGEKEEERILKAEFVRLGCDIIVKDANELLDHLDP